MINLKTKKLKPTPSELLILDYINEHYKLIPFLTVAELTKKTNSTAPSIYRLCDKLGFESYKGLQQHIFNDFILSKDTSTENIYINSILSILNINSDSEIKKFKKQIIKYRRVYLYGMGYSQQACQYFERLLSRIGVNTTLLPCCNTHFDEIKNMPKKSLIIFISYSGETAELQTWAKLIPSHVKKTSLTSNRQNPLAKMCEQNFFIPYISQNYLGAHRYSFVLFSILINMLCPLSVPVKKGK